MSRRFNLDPRAPPTARPPPPRAPTTPTASATAPRPFSAPPPFGAAIRPDGASAPDPTAPAAAPAAPPAARRRRTMYLVAAIVAVLLVGGGVAIYAATDLTYPNKYVLDDDEMPSGVSNARMSRGDLADAGMEKNPGAMDEEQFKSDYPTRNQPEEAHSQVLQTSAGRVVVLSLRYADEDTARAAAAEARALCSFAGAAALRDGDVLLLVVGDDTPSDVVAPIVRTLKEKVSSLDQACGPR